MNTTIHSMKSMESDTFETFYTYPKDLFFDKLDEEGINFAAIQQYKSNKKISIVKLMHYIGAL